jgi:integrase
MLWQDLASEYKRTVSVNHADGGIRDGATIRQLEKHFGRIALADLRRADLLDYINNRNQQVKEATTAKEARLFKTIWKYALNSEYIQTNPWDGVTITCGLPPIKEPITEEEEERLLSALPESCRLLFRFMALTGARGIEARFIAKTDVELNNGVVYVKGKTRKGEVERQPIILDDEAASVVKQAMRNSTEWLFPNPKNGKPFADIRSTFNRIVKQVGLQGRVKGPHDLRHIFVSRLVQAGTDIVTAANLSRHKDVRMLQRYTHLSADHLRQTLANTRKKKRK